MIQIIMIMYLSIILAGVIIPFASILKINKKHKYISQKTLILLEIIFLIVFIVFAKIFQVILDKDYESLVKIFKDNIKYIINFIISGYTFIGGYLGSVLAVWVMLKNFNINKRICFWLINNLNLMYAILKLACFINGCCYGFTIIPIQLLECIITCLIYVIINCAYIKKIDTNNCIALSIMLFSIERFIISFYRAYMTDLAFLGTELICILLIIIGINISLRKVDVK